MGNTPESGVADRSDTINRVRTPRRASSRPGGERRLAGQLFLEPKPGPDHGPDHVPEPVAEVESHAVRKSLSQTALYRAVMRSTGRVPGAGPLAGCRRDGDWGVVPEGHGGGGAPSSKKKGRRVGRRGGRRPRGVVTAWSAVFPTPPQSRASSLWSPMALPEGGWVKSTTTHGGCLVRCVNVHVKSLRGSDVGWHCGRAQYLRRVLSGRLPADRRRRLGEDTRRAG